jgi:hypothetical protein
MQAPSGQSGRLMEIPVLIALVGLAIAVGLGERSWLAGLLTLVGIPIAFYAVFAGWEMLELAYILARARRAMNVAESRLDGVRNLEASALRFRNVRWLAAKAGSALANTIDDDDREVRVSAAKALVQMDCLLDEAAPPVVEALRHGEHRIAALECLRTLGPRGSEAVPTLVALLAQRGAPWWWMVVNALQMIGPAAQPAVPALIAALEAAQADEGLWPIYALGAIGDRRALPALEKFANECRDERVRENAREAIARIEAGGHPANQP